MQSMYWLYPNNGSITPCYHIFLSLSLYWYFNSNRNFSLRVSDLTWRGSLFSSPYCSSGAEKHVPAIKNRMLIHLISTGAVFTAQKDCLLGEAKESFHLKNWAQLTGYIWKPIIKHSHIILLSNFLSIVSETIGNFLNCSFKIKVDSCPRPQQWRGKNKMCMSINSLFMLIRTAHL